MSGLFKLSRSELDAMKELEMRFEDRLPQKLKEDETLFYRFLKARDFDVNKAELMLRKHIAWRKAFQVDTILETFTPKEVFLKYMSLSILGIDKEGNSVTYIPAGKIDPRDLENAMKVNDLLKHFIWFIEYEKQFIKLQNVKSGRHAYQAVLIFNLNELTFSTVTSKSILEICLRVMHLLQDNNPENMKNIFIINAPAYFTILFSLVKKIMSSAMIKKIHVFGQSGWKDALLEVVDADVLPAFLGGTRTDPDGDPECKTFIGQCDRIPPKYFLTYEERYFKDTDDVKRVIVPPSSDHKVLAEVEVCGSVMQWKFEIKSKDIGFGLFYQDTQETLEEILPIQRMITIDGSESGSFKCRSAGTYVIIFDNSHSWLHSKEVLYCVTVGNTES